MKYWFSMNYWHYYNMMGFCALAETEWRRKRSWLMIMMYRVGLMPSLFLSLSLSIAHTHKELVSGSLRDDNDGDNIDHSDQGLSSCRIFYSFHLLISLLFFPFFYHTFLLHVGFACRVKWTMSECRHGCQSRNGVSVCRHDVGPCYFAVLT